MRKYLFITLFISVQVLTFSCIQTIDEDEEVGYLNIVSGYLIYKGEKFTGTILKKNHETNSLLYKHKYEKGLLNGVQEDYYNSGELKEKGEYLNGTKNGVFEKYNPKGLLSESSTWSKDKRIKFKFYFR